MRLAFGESLCKNVLNFMLIVMKRSASDDDVTRVLAKIEKLGFTSKVIDGNSRRAIAIIGNDGAIDPTKFESLSGVAEAIRITKPHKLTTREAHTENTIVAIGDAVIGGEDLALIAGVCSVESPEQVFEVANIVKKSGARFFRGGAYKPRTSPYAFQGLGEEAFKILAEVRERFGLKIVTEAIDEKSVDLVEKFADVIQIGTRNMQNYSLLKRAGRAQLPVLLKRGMSATVDEWLLAAEYILSEGNSRVILCERGIRTFSNHARNTLDLSAVPAVQRMSHLPIIIDPSHGTGKNYMVAPLARAGVAVGANGIMLEIHPHPENALSDGSQALTPSQYLQLVGELNAIHKLIIHPLKTVAISS